MSRRGCLQGSRRFPGGAVLSFTPLAISGAIGWWRGDLGVTTATGVSVWANQVAGDANSNFVQATTGKQPTLSAGNAAWNGQTVLTSNGTKAMQSVGTWAVSLAQPKTYICVGRQTTADANNRQFMDGVVGRQIAFGAATTGNISTFSSGTLSSTTTWLNNKRVVLIAANGASSSIFVDDSATAKATGNPGASTPTGLILGWAASDANTWIGEWAELIVYNRLLTAAERLTIFQYLGARYAITVS